MAVFFLAVPFLAAFFFLAMVLFLVGIGVGLEGSADSATLTMRPRLTRALRAWREMRLRSSEGTRKDTWREGERVASASSDAPVSLR